MEPSELLALEAAAVLHDIACTLCRKKYGNTYGRYQESEGKILAEQFQQRSGLSAEIVNRIIYLVSNHHSPENVEGRDHQILLEADYLVNADENGYSKANISNALNKLFRTKKGKAC